MAQALRSHASATRRPRRRRHWLSPLRLGQGVFSALGPVGRAVLRGAAASSGRGVDQNRVTPKRKARGMKACLARLLAPFNHQKSAAQRNMRRGHEPPEPMDEQLKERDRDAVEKWRAAMARIREHLPAEPGAATSSSSASGEESGTDPALEASELEEELRDPIPAKTRQPNGTASRAQELRAWQDYFGAPEQGDGSSGGLDGAVDGASQSTWRLEAASLPRLAGLSSHADPLSMLLLPSEADDTLVLLLYEGGAVASYNLSGALVASAEYAAGGASPSAPRSFVSIMLTAVALCIFVLSVTVFTTGLRVGRHVPPSSRIWNLLQGSSAAALRPVRAVSGWLADLMASGDGQADERLQGQRHDEAAEGAREPAGSAPSRGGDGVVHA